uniref:Uncharacterized protein n=1 Tax=Romanomermis culicivorax TaxID=13658 RepID=A0A915K7C1_ROMCU
NINFRTAERVKQEFGTIDILINNAGIVSGKDIFECPDEKIAKVMNVNTMAHIW